MRVAALFIALAVALPAPLSLKDVMRRVGVYVDAYGDKASIVVCTEKYDQRAAGWQMPEQTRTLVSDVALVYADAIHGWIGFRDVIEVNGEAVQNREDRLARVLMGAEGRFDEARRLSDESARFNVGNLQRNFNIPTSALFFFLSENLDRFKFASRRVTDDGAWEIAFRETGKPTMIRTPDGSSIATAGTMWVRPEDGVVTRTVLAMDVTLHSPEPRRHVVGSIDVRYRRVETLGMWLPDSMDEAFDGTRDKSRDDAKAWDKVTGHAEYSNYRRFETSGRIKK